MKLNTFVLSLSLFFVALHFPADYVHAQGAAHKYSAHLGAGGMFFEANEEVESGQLYQLTLGRRINDRWSAEWALGGMPFLNKRNGPDAGDSAWVDDTWGLTSGLEAIYHLKEPGESECEPFLAAGGGINYFSNDLNNEHFDPIGTLGGGVSHWIDDDWTVRGDYRVVVAGTDTEINHRALISVGYHWTPGDSWTSSGKPALCKVFFPFDSATIGPKGKAELKKHANWLKANKDAKITVEGHCDERGTGEYNYALGQRRANAAFEYLRSLGISSSRLQKVSYGEDSPADSRANEKAWAKNRRAVCVEDE